MNRVLGSSLVVMALSVSGDARAGDIYVSMSCGSDSLGTTGVVSDPFQTIDFARGFAVSGDVLHVLGGSTTAAHYSAANGEVFPLDIVASDSGIRFQGEEDPFDPGSLPMLGGDVQQAAEALIRIFAVGVDGSGQPNGGVSGVEIRGIVFVGEDASGLDAPVGIRAVVADGNELEITIADNTFERPALNSSGASGLATISFEVDEGQVLPGSSIRNNLIYCSDRGGIEFLVGATGSDSTAWTSFPVERNYIQNVARETTLVGLSWHALDQGHPDPDSNYRGLSKVVGNIIRGRGGMVHGLQLVCEENTTMGVPEVTDNRIEGCSSHGFVASADGWDNPEVPEIAMRFRRNRIVSNGGSGVFLEWDASHNSQNIGMGYLHLLGESNLIAENHRFGIEAVGIESQSFGVIQLGNDTLAANRLGGMSFDDSDPYDSTPLASLGTYQGGVSVTIDASIIYFNNCSAGNCSGGLFGDQVLGLASSLMASKIWAQTRTSDVLGIPLGSGDPCDPTQDASGNIDCDPLFVNVAQGDFHLSVSPFSPCIDVGAGLGLTQLDVDGDDRIQDGDYDCVSALDPVVDMGYDEVPEPGCSP